MNSNARSEENILGGSASLTERFANRIAGIISYKNIKG